MYGNLVSIPNIVYGIKFNFHLGKNNKEKGISSPVTMGSIYSMTSDQ